MVHELSYDEENGIAVLIFKSHILLRDIDAIFTKLKELLDGKPNRQLLIVMNSAYNVENRETREALTNEAIKLDVNEVALVGLSAAVRMIARVILKTGTVKLKGEFFKDQEEAIKWLKSKRKFTMEANTDIKNAKARIEHIEDVLSSVAAGKLYVYYNMCKLV